MPSEPIQNILEWIEINRAVVYTLLFGYCALKSGALPFFAGLVASTGALDVSLVAIATFLGGYLGDELRFFVARRYGDRLWRLKPRIKGAVSRAVALLERYGARYIFLYRYPKGMRTIGALPVGLGSMNWRRFTLLNASSAALWTGIIVGLGYVFGAQIEEFVIESWTIFSVSLLAVFAFSVYFVYRKHWFGSDSESHNIDQFRDR